MSKIALIGFKNAGKTTLGKRLFQTTKIPFRDIDEEICLSVGTKCIREFFETHGKEAFMEAENQAISAVLNEENIILATGGALCENTKAINLLRKNNFVFIFVNTHSSIIFQRIMEETTKPYFLKEIPDCKTEEKFFEIYNSRKEKYLRMADIITIP